MASQVVSFTVTAATAQNITDGLNAFVYQNGYQDTVINPADGTPMANPETKIAFAKRMTYEFWKNAIKAYNARASAATAVTTATSAVDSTYSFS